VTSEEYIVSRKSLMECVEYTDIEPTLGDDDVVDIDQFATSWQDPTRLGLHRSAYTNRIRPSHFVGAVWLPALRASFKVSPKVGNVDAVRMFSEIGQYFDLLGDIRTLFRVWPEEESIPAANLLDELSLLQVAIYLRELARFCQRELKQEMLSVRENLIGKMKGRVLVAHDLRLNRSRGRADRVVCQYNIVSRDNLPNQILRSALSMSIAYLSRFPMEWPIFWQWARTSEAALSGVSLRRIVSSDFRGLRYSGFLRRYRAIHRLAKMLIVRLRVEAGGRVSEVRDFRTVPFSLNMNRLFEAYVGVKLRKAGVPMYFQQVRPVRGERLKITIKPDYVSGDGCGIVDAKYKIIEEGEEGTVKTGEGMDLSTPSSGLNNADLYQVIAYSMIEGGDSTAERRAFLAVPSPPAAIPRASWRAALVGQVPNDVPHLKIPIPGSTMTVGVLSCRLPLMEERRVSLIRGFRDAVD
jgi:5-methylcytosine-specific restriction endonuclease McrBC regulatory subunit McrC